MSSSPSPPAIEISNLSKTYSSSSSSSSSSPLPMILSNFSMNVPTGAIYSLLGPSGVGKSTIFSCILGLTPWQAGSIQLFAGTSHREPPPSSSSSTTHTLPRSVSQRIGYMPQTLSLYDYLTPQETLRYFGKLHDDGMTNNNLASYLIRLLDLEDERLVRISELSGGQKRRVSLAIALLNNPDLLILDEPTVGLDPILRNKIWLHFSTNRNNNKTILITTHYIEEASRSDKIGLLRQSRLLTETTPQALLISTSTNLLQQAILQICSSSSNNKKSEEEEDKNESNNISKKILIPPIYSSTKKEIIIINPLEEEEEEIIVTIIPATSSSSSSSNNYSFPNIKASWRRTTSFTHIIWIYLLRQPIFAFILLLMPITQLLMTFLIIGKPPTNLNIGVINNETCNNTLHANNNNNNNCELNYLSCSIINYLANTGKFNLHHLHNKSTAENSISHHQPLFSAYITFPPNYSTNLLNRLVIGRFAESNEILENSKLIAVVDKSHYLAYNEITTELFNSLKTLVPKKLSLKTCGLSSNNLLAENQEYLHFRNPVYGTPNVSHQDTILPAIVTQILFEILYAIAPMIMIKDVTQGTSTRSNLTGLQFTESITAILLAMTPILLLQSVSCYAIILLLFHSPSSSFHGGIITFVNFMVVCMLSGLCGEAFGVLVGLLLKTELGVIVSAIVLIPVIMSCSGTLWPLEAHPTYLKPIYYLFPSAPLVSSLRSVVSRRGVGLTHFLVWPGLVNAVVWIGVFWGVSVWVFNNRHSRGRG